MTKRPSGASTRSSPLSPPASRRRRARRGGRRSAAPRSTATCTAGRAGAGHFVKMVHNGIEYGLMAAYAEGLNILHHANAGKQRRDRRCRDHAAAPPRALPVRPEPGRHRRGLAPRQRDRLVAAGLDRAARCSRARIWRTSTAGCRTRARGAGRSWRPSTKSVPAPVLSAALYERFSSRGEADFADKVLSAMRYEFGGHEEKAAAAKGGA